MPYTPHSEFPYEHFVWEHNPNFIHYAGSYAIPVAYDTPHDELDELLDQLNGFYFTGGALDVFDSEGEPHVYYNTAKQIFEYSKRQKDLYGIEWPIFGIC